MGTADCEECFDYGQDACQRHGIETDPVQDINDLFSAPVRTRPIRTRQVDKTAALRRHADPFTYARRDR